MVKDLAVKDVSHSKQENHAWKEIMSESIDLESRIDLFISSQWALFSMVFSEEGEIFIFTDGKDVVSLSKIQLSKKRPFFWKDLMASDIKKLAAILESVI